MKEIKLPGGEILCIREAESQDAENLISYLNQVGGESDNLLFGKDEFGMTAKEESAFIERMKNMPNMIMVLGIINGEIISCAQVSQRGPRRRITHRGAIAISVKKAFWGKSVGSEITKCLLEYAKQFGIEIVELEVKSDNPAAIALYEKMGFEKVGQYQKFFKFDDGTYADADVMQCFLKDK